MCCSPVCVLLHGQRNSLYTDKGLSCLSVGFFCAEGCYSDCYSWLLLVWLVISPHPSSQEKETQSAVTSARSSLDSCRLFSRCMTVTPSSPPACPTSVVIQISCLCFSWLSWGLSSGRHARMLHAGFTTWLLDWFLRISPKTDSVLNTCRVK